MLRLFTTASLVLLISNLAFAGEGSSPMKFKKLRLSDDFLSEGASFGDINGDGKMDIVSGPYWYEGPDFKTKHEFYKSPGAIDPHGYSKNFFAWCWDVNNDGKMDIVVIGFPGEDCSWFENPGSPTNTSDGEWIKHKMLDGVDSESPNFVDLLGNGERQIVCLNQGYLGYATPGESDPTKPWIYHRISPHKGWHKFTHGLGIGDVNGDGKNDIIMSDGWWEQPKDLSEGKEWTFHKANFGEGGAQYVVYDVDNDGVPDVIGAVQAHGYGLAWWKQTRNAGGESTWEKHTIMGKTKDESVGGVVFTQGHALALVDVDGDGVMDIVTGKRWWAHPPGHDPETDHPAVTYVFKLSRNNGQVTWTPYLVDDDTGVGTQVAVGDVNGDGKPDIVVGNKKGTTVLMQE